MATIRLCGFALLVVSGCGDAKGPHARSGPDSAPLAPIAARGEPVEIPKAKTEGCVASKDGKDYEVGPGAKYENVVDVPWESLGPGDTVRIHWKAGGYHEKILISASGTEKSPLRICGIAGPNGDRPIIDGDGAKTRPKAKLAYAFDPQQQRGVVIVSLDGRQRYGYKPRHLVIEGLDIRHAHEDHAFKDSLGEEHHYLPNAAGLFIERGEDIVVRDCVIDDNSNGFFVASGDDEATLSRRITFESNYVFGNGTTGPAFDRHHDIYSEAIGMTYQFNHIGPLREGAGGSALKDRSAGTIVRYNWIEGGARSLDLVEAEESWKNEKDDPTYPDAWVYGNAIIAGPESSSNLVHFGGDNGSEEKYRRGTLYFYDNTVVVRTDQSKRWQTSVFELSTNDQTVDARNNLFYVTSTTPGATPTNLTLMNQYGHAFLGKTLSSPLALFADGRETKGKVDGENLIAKLAPSTSPFRDVGTLDLVPAAGSPAVGAAVGLAKNEPPIDREYVKHLGDKPRVAKDVGAFEHE